MCTESLREAVTELLRDHSVEAILNVLIESCDENAWAGEVREEQVLTELRELTNRAANHHFTPTA